MPEGAEGRSLSQLMIAADPSSLRGWKHGRMYPGNHLRAFPASPAPGTFGEGSRLTVAAPT